MSKDGDVIRLLDEAEEKSRRDEKTEAARALEAYEKRMEEQAEESAGSAVPVTDKTVIREPVAPKKIMETAPIKPEEQVIEVSERIAADEKRPIHITEDGRLPLSVSIETDGGMVSRIAQIGDTLPIKCTREFSTENAGVTTAALNLYAGERPLVSQNKLISKTKIKGIRALPQGRSVITIGFEIDEKYNINISVIDEGSLKKTAKSIDSSWKPSEEEIYRMVQEAQDNLKEDDAVRKRSGVLQQARESIFMADFVLKSKKKDLSMSKKGAIRKKSKKLRKKIHKADILKMTDAAEKEIYDILVSLNEEMA